MSTSLAHWLNQHCFCNTIIPLSIAHHLQPLGALEKKVAAIFNPYSIYVSQGTMNTINAFITAYIRLASLPAFQQTILKNSPYPMPTSVSGDLLSFDFHLSLEGPRLIEINTNPAGAYYAAILDNSNQGCAQHGIQNPHYTKQLTNFEQQIFQLFSTTWRHLCPSRALKTVLILDNHPKNQHYYPEFLLYQRAFSRHGVQTIIADPSELSLTSAGLSYQNIPIDMIYNRLTDFYLQQPLHHAIREAWLNRQVILSPSPHAYALHADKSNLIVFSDLPRLQALGCTLGDQGLISATLPKTMSTQGLEPDWLWQRRKDYYFKPLTGFGSKGVFLGSKITHRVFNEIITGPYLIQENIPPSRRTVQINDEITELRVDIRAYRMIGPEGNLLPYQSNIARVYHGQTTNFSTPGSGFSPILITQN